MIAVLLCTMMITTTLFNSASVFAGTEKSTPSANIEDYLDDAQILIEGGEVYDPQNSISTEGSFSVKLEFSEITNGRQFPDDGIMTYQVPSAIKALTSLKDQPINDTANDNMQIGTYDIKDGVITVKLNSDYVQEYQNISAFLTFDGEFSSKEIENKEEISIVFSDSVSMDVKLEKAATLSISKSVGNYDYENDRIDYTITVSTNYTAENVMVYDRMNANMSLVEGTIQVKDQAGNEVTFETVTPGAQDSWKINVGTMAKGETYTITYQCCLSDTGLQKIQNSSSGTDQFEFTNTAYAKADNSEEVDATAAKKKLSFSRITKSVEEKNGKLKWTVTVNATKHMELDGYTVTDTLDSEALKLDKTQAMTITKNKTAITDVPDWSQLSGNSDKKWSYTFSAGAGKSTYTFVYYTNLPEGDSEQTAETGKGTKFKNNVTLSKGSLKYNGSATYTSSAVEFAKKKFNACYNSGTYGNNIVVDENGDIYLRWCTELIVPPSGLKNLKITDKIIPNKAHKDHKLLENLKVKSGKPSKNDGFDEIVVDTGEKYTGGIGLKQEGTDGFELTFDSALPANASKYTVKVTYYTKVTEAPHENGTWRNWGYAYIGTNEYSDWENYDALNLFMTGKKSGIFDASTGEITWTVNINTAYQGAIGDLVMEDTYSNNQEFDSDHGIYMGVTNKNGNKGTRLDDSKVVVDSSQSKFTATLGNLKNNTSYTLTYKTKVKDGVFASAGEKSFENTANISGKNVEISLPAKVGVTNKIMDKAVSQEPTNYNDYEAEFTITVNPNRVLVNSESAEKANDYEITDTYSKTMEVDLNSFVVVRDDKDVLSADKNEYTIAHSEGTDVNQLDISIPAADGHKYTITYKAAIMGAIGQEITYSNMAKLKVVKEIDKDDVEDQVKIEKLSSGAGASASKLAISAEKYNTANTNKKLQGAEFSLYKDSVSDENLIGKQVTGEDGIALFGQGAKGNNLTYQGESYYLEAGVKYILKETKAPEGYEISGEEKVFQLRDKKGNASIEGVDAYNVGKVFGVGNKKYNFYINKVDQDGNVLKGAEFALYSDAGCTGDPEYTAAEDKEGHFTFKGLLVKKTYYMKETKVPNGYHDSGKVYKVEIDENGDATIDGEKVGSDRTYTVTNTLAGSISVTKEVKQDGLGVATDLTFHAALFSDSELKNRVSDVKELAMNGNESTTVTFDNVKINETYYVAETDEDGNALPDQSDSQEQVISYDNQVLTLDPNNMTGEAKITNSYYSEYYWAGSIDVIKNVTIDGNPYESNSIFYVGLFADEEYTQRVGDIKPLVMDGKASTKVTFEDLSINQTYYVAETDAAGNVITDSQDQLGCQMTIDQNTFNLTEGNLTGTATIINDFPNEEQFYYGGQITVNKTTTFNGKPYKTDEVFYVALFADKAREERVTDVKALKMDGKAAAKVSFENLEYGTYYLAETDKDGNALSDMKAAELGFTNLMDEEIKLDADAVEIDLENQMTEEYVTEHGGDPDGTGVQTGDNSNMSLLILVMIMALTAMGIVLVSRRRKTS